MKLIIDIPEEKYDFIKWLDRGCTDYQTTLMLYDAVRYSTPIEDNKKENSKEGGAKIW